MASEAAGHKVQPPPCPASPACTLRALIGNDSCDEEEQGGGNTEAWGPLGPMGPGEEKRANPGVESDTRDPRNNSLKEEKKSTS